MPERPGKRLGILAFFVKSSMLTHGLSKVKLTLKHHSCLIQDTVSWHSDKPIPVDVEQCPRLKAVFYIPSLQDIPIMLFFQFVSFLSKGFNVSNFLIQP